MGHLRGVLTHARILLSRAVDFSVVAAHRSSVLVHEVCQPFEGQCWARIQVERAVVVCRVWENNQVEPQESKPVPSLDRPVGKRVSTGRSEATKALDRLDAYRAPEYLSLGPEISSLTLPSSLYLYQLEGIYTLTKHGELLLADDMGLGKTVQAIVAMRVLIRRRSIANALIVVPASLVRQWEQELQRWAPDLWVSVAYGSPAARHAAWKTPAHVYLTSYESLRSDSSYRSGPAAYSWDLVVLDEGQKIKNVTTKTSKTCRALSRRRSWILTGTPLENSVDELASVLSFVRPNAELLDGRGRAADLQNVRSVQRQIQLRRKREAVLHQLPKLQRLRVVLPLTDSQRQAYESVLNEGVMHLAELGAEVTVQHVLSLITRLKQICNFCPKTGASAKIEDLRERLVEIVAQGHKALVFTQFTCEQFGARRIVRELDDLEPLLYTGDMGPSERQRVVDEFTRPDGPPVLVMSLRAGGLGLNLQAASYVVHFDSWWNPAVTSQAEARAHRLGQRRAVTAYEYVMVDTIEERIMEIIERKKALFKELVDDVSISLGTLGLTKEEYLEALGLSSPRRERS